MATPWAGAECRPDRARRDRSMRLSSWVAALLVAGMVVALSPPPVAAEPGAEQQVVAPRLVARGCRGQHRGLPPPLHRSGLRRRTGLDRHRDRAGTAEPDREMVIALPPTTARHLRLVSGATSGSWWSIHELNLRTVDGSADPVRPGAGLVRATGRLPDGTWVDGYYNAGSTAAEVPWPIDGFGYTYRLPPTAALTFALPGSSPATQRADPASTLERPGTASPNGD